MTEYENFELHSCKLTDKGLDVKHTERGSMLPGPNNKEGKVEAHPDLVNALDALKPYVADKIGLIDPLNKMLLFLGEMEQAEEHVKQQKQDILERVRITGFSYEGEGDLAGVNIKGYLKFPKLGGTGFATGKISFASKTLGYETEVKDLCETATREVYAYRYENKKAQLDIETQAKNQAGMFPEGEEEE